MVTYYDCDAIMLEMCIANWVGYYTILYCTIVLDMRDASYAILLLYYTTGDSLWVGYDPPTTLYRTIRIATPSE